MMTSNAHISPEVWYHVLDGGDAYDIDFPADGDGPMVTKAPEAPNSDSMSAQVEAPPLNVPESGDTPPQSKFVRLADLAAPARRDPFETLRTLVGQEILFLSIDKTDGKTGSAMVTPLTNVTETADGFALKDAAVKITLPRGGLRRLQAGLDKLPESQSLVATVIQRKRGFGFE